MKRTLYLLTMPIKGCREIDDASGIDISSVPTTTSPTSTAVSATTSPITTSTVVSAPVNTTTSTTSPAPVNTTTSPAPVTTSPAPVTTSPAPVTIQPSHDSGKCGGTCSGGNHVFSGKSNHGETEVTYFEESCSKVNSTLGNKQCPYFRYPEEDTTCVYMHRGGFCSCNEGTDEFTFNHEFCQPRMQEIVKEIVKNPTPGDPDNIRNPRTWEVCKAIGLTDEQRELCKNKDIAINSPAPVTDSTSSPAPVTDSTSSPAPAVSSDADSPAVSSDAVQSIVSRASVTTIQPSQDSGKCGGTCSHGNDLLKTSNDGISVSYFKESCSKAGVAKQTDCAYFRYSVKDATCVYTPGVGFCSCGESTGEFTLNNESCGLKRILEIAKDIAEDIKDDNVKDILKDIAKKFNLKDIAKDIVKIVQKPAL